MFVCSVSGKSGWNGFSGDICFIFVNDVEDRVVNGCKLIV
jgi:hypothetical protein